MPNSVRTTGHAEITKITPQYLLILFCFDHHQLSTILSISFVLSIILLSSKHTRTQTHTLSHIRQPPLSLSLLSCIFVKKSQGRDSGNLFNDANGTESFPPGITCFPRFRLHRITVFRLDPHPIHTFPRGPYPISIVFSTFPPKVGRLAPDRIETQFLPFQAHKTKRKLFPPVQHAIVQRFTLFSH